MYFSFRRIDMNRFRKCMSEILSLNLTYLDPVAMRDYPRNGHHGWGWASDQCKFKCYNDRLTGRDLRNCFDNCESWKK